MDQTLKWTLLFLYIQFSMTLKSLHLVKVRTYISLFAVAINNECNYSIVFRIMQCSWLQLMLYSWLLCWLSCNMFLPSWLHVGCLGLLQWLSGYLSIRYNMCVWKLNTMSITFYATAPPAQPTNLVVSVYSTSVRVTWYIPQVRFGFETYYIQYGLSMEALDMQSRTIIGGPEENATYSITLENLLPLTTYYYRVQATNIVGSTPSNVDMFTTRKFILYMFNTHACGLTIPTCIPQWLLWLHQ